MTKANITFVRLTDDQNTAILQLVATGPGNKSDHIRQAVAEYIARQHQDGRLTLPTPKEQTHEGQLERLTTPPAAGNTPT